LGVIVQTGDEGIAFPAGFEEDLPAPDADLLQHPDGRLPQKGLKIFWEIAVQSGDVKEPWPESK